MTSPERIGIIGVGDLGQRLAVQACSIPSKVFVYDRVPRKIPKKVVGIDPDIHQKAMLSLPEWVSSMDEVIDSADVVHFTAAPLRQAAQSLTRLPGDSLLVFHSSVMDESMREIDRLQGVSGITGSLAVVHCLMNPRRTVLVNPDAGETDRVSSHLSSLGLRPVEMTTAEADHISAVSQAPMAMLHTNFGCELEDFDRQGFLTPSGHDLVTALNARAANWTEQTLRTILSNPAIGPSLLDRMKDMIYEQQNGSNQ